MHNNQATHYLHVRQYFEKVLGGITRNNDSIQLKFIYREHQDSFQLSDVFLVVPVLIMQIDIYGILELMTDWRLLRTKSATPTSQKSLTAPTAMIGKSAHKNSLLTQLQICDYWKFIQP